MPTHATITARHADTPSRVLFGVEAPETTASDLVQQTWPRQVLPHDLANTTRHFRATGKREPGREVAPADAPAREAEASPGVAP